MPNFEKMPIGEELELTTSNCSFIESFIVYDRCSFRTLRLMLNSLSRFGDCPDARIELTPAIIMIINISFTLSPLVKIGRVAQPFSRFFCPSEECRVPLDKSEGVVKDKQSLAMRKHRDPRQRG